MSFYLISLCFQLNSESTNSFGIQSGLLEIAPCRGDLYKPVFKTEQINNSEYPNLLSNET